MSQDISKAYFFAPATRDIYVELPPEDAEDGMVGKLEKSLYGTRDAALNWAEAYTEVLLGMGFEKGTSSPCSFVHYDWDLRTVVHGDDFLTEGSAKNLKKMDNALRKDFLVKTEVIGPDADQVRQGRVLNRVITWEDEGITWEPDPRHVEIVVQQMGLTNAKPLLVPGVKPAAEKKVKEEVDTVEDDWHLRCGTCHMKFGSRNELFEHLHKEDHTRRGEAPAVARRPAEDVSSVRPGSGRMAPPLMYQPQTKPELQLPRRNSR